MNHDVLNTFGITTETDLLDDLVRLLADGLVVVDQVDEDDEPRFQLTRKGTLIREFHHRGDSQIGPT